MVIVKPPSTGVEQTKVIDLGWAQLQEIDLVLPRLSPVFDGLRLVQISDLHYGSWLTLDLLDTLVSEVNRLQGDIIAITGDFVHHSKGRRVQELIDPLRGLSALQGVFGVLGNHDCKAGQRQVVEMVGAAGVRLLQNQVATLYREGERLHIAGIGSWYYKQDRLERVMENLRVPGVAILLAHEPDFADLSARTGRFDLQISGHSHGGQIVLPRVGPLYLPRCGLKYPHGLYRIDGMIQYTNRGLGTSHLRLRLNCPPEITVFNLHTPSPA